MYQFYCILFRPFKDHNYNSRIVMVKRKPAAPPARAAVTPIDDDVTYLSDEKDDDLLEAPDKGGAAEDQLPLPQHFFTRVGRPRADHWQRLKAHESKPLPPSTEMLNIRNVVVVGVASDNAATGWAALTLLPILYYASAHQPRI